jgi:N-acetylneuraminic acid mutarotase
VDGDQPQAFLFFGETPLEEAYHLPERLADTEVFLRSAGGERTKLDTKRVETDDRIGKVAPIAGDEPCVLEATKQYGLYGKTLLVYYAKHVHANSSDDFNAAGRSKDLKLDIVPRANGEEYELTVYWDGKPLPGAEVKVAAGDAEGVEKTTDEDGHISAKPEGDGILNVLANYMDKEQAGELDGEAYKGVLHYASLTFERPVSAEADKSEVSRVKPQAPMPSLPEPVSSFGAVVADGWVYVYSGHTGEEHEHSAANLSNHFRRIKLEGGTEWEELPMQTPLQGMPLVAHGGKIYRVGGLNARNATTKNKEDLHSTAEFAEFDPPRSTWKSLAPLPAPRSSHNAVVIGGQLYVVGGWHLHGKSPGDWQVDALAYDFDEPQSGWQKLPEPPFKRRALAVAEWQEKLVAIGGMNEAGKISQQVDVFDPATGQWSRGPDLPGTGMAGFGGSACTLDGQIYASGLRGIVYRLNDSGSAWEEAARLDKPRFFHQLLPAGDGVLLAVAGATRKGHLADIELVDVSGERPDTGETAWSGSTRRVASVQPK